MAPMNLRNRAIVSFVCAICVAHVWARAQGPASKPSTAPVEWGTAKAGMQVSLAVQGRPAAGEKLFIRIALRNSGTAPVALAQKDKLFGWLLLIYTREKAYLTARIYPAAKARDWPGELPGGKTISLPPVEISSLEVYSYADRPEVVKSYLSPDEAKLPKPAGKLHKALIPRQGALLLRLCVRPPGKNLLLVSSAKVTLAPAAPDLKKLDSAARKAFIAKLLEQFRESPFAGQKAHELAVKIGPQLVGELAKAIRDSRASHAQMWLTAALTDIRCKEAADELVRLIKHPQGHVRHVVAYHGPKQRSKELDEAIIAVAATGNDADLTGRALQGFAAFRGTVPPELAGAALKSSSPRTRSMLAETLAARPNKKNAQMLLPLLKDTNERVRAITAKSLVKMNIRTRSVIAALVAALDLPGKSAGDSISAALASLTGQKPKAPAEWKQWWAQGRQDWKEP